MERLMNKPIYETNYYLFFFINVGDGYIKIRDKNTMRSTIFSLEELEEAIKKIKEKVS